MKQILILMLTGTTLGMILEVKYLDKDPLLLTEMRKCRIQEDNIKVVHPINLTNLEDTVIDLERLFYRIVDDKSDFYELLLHKITELYTNLKSIQQALLEPYEKDRSGACATSHIDNIVTQLKNKHEDRYGGFKLNYRLWATQISNSETHLQQQMINNPPPLEMIRDFSYLPNESARILSSNYDNLSVGKHINEDVHVQLKSMGSTFESIKSNMETNLNDFMDLYNRFKGLLVATDTRRQLLEVIPHQVPQEIATSQALFDAIIDCEDVDHREDEPSQTD